ncbi:transient receptor potential cation channel subfamily A member 1-like [Salvelinus namaycush]|uniref:Transient receptor potential cation channel subfamily A member 1-like n=1 Tax=Salvelinus namaycush TaxID=8040 RepID=A0A8U0P5U4_SALNM|nr:transient receptor potential cation channel subfamily A member 1-like [Salvelinus namaycush]
MQDKTYQSVMYGDDATQISDKIFEWALQGDSAALEKHSAHLGVRDHANASPLHYATSHGHISTIQLIVQLTGPDELSASDEEGNTSLHWAVQKTQRESCACLLDLGANPNILNRRLMSPLHMAVSLGHNTLIELLLSHSNTDANLEGELGNTPVMLACCVDNHEALHLLFKYGARLCQQNKLGHYPIHAAAFAGAKKSMQVVLQKGEEIGYSIETHINYVDKSFSTPLHLAVRGGNLEVIKLCIEQGAKMDQQQCDKSTALHFACTQGATEAVKLMLSAHDRVGDVINLTDGACQTPLHKTTIFDHVELAEYLISKSGDINAIDCKGHTPLLLATSCSAWKTVSLLLTHGANLKIKDKHGCNFLHLAILQPKGLTNLPPEFLKCSSVRELLDAEDNEGCTPMHYACRLGIPESVKNMLRLNVSLDQKSKQKKSALHFAAEYGRINTCHRLLESMTNTRLLNEGDERGMTPLHLASRGGHVIVVDLLLRKGALFHSDYKGWTCLHHAAAEGYTQTIIILLASNIKLLDKTDEDRNTALHLAAREGHAAAVTLLLDRGAQITLNKSDASFLHEAVLNGRKDAAIAVIHNERCAEAMLLFKVKSTKRCVVMDMIEFLPESFKHLLDTCVKESDDDINSTNYSIEYTFRWLQAPMHVIKLAKADKSFDFQPLTALNYMVKFNRIELLTHPVCKKYLEMKWNAYGMKVHLLNLAIYSLGLGPLTHIIHTLKPILNTNVTNTTSPSSSSSSSVGMVTTSFDEQCYIITTCMFLILAMSLYAVGKELVQIVQQGSKYFCDVTNALDWGAAISTLLFVIPLLMDLKDTWHWEAGVVAVLLSWINFLLYFQRFERVGIYVVMFLEIAKTLISIIVLFFFLLLAFALAFYALMLDHVSSIPLVIMQTFVMMAGELNYQENVLKPFLGGILPFPYLTYCIFVMFTFAVPILLINLMIGLAVGDIAEVQANAELKQIGMQIELHTSLEEKMPYWLMKRVDQISLTEYPNRACDGKREMLFSMLGMGHERTTLNLTSHPPTLMEQEISKQKYRLKEMSNIIEKQHNLLKLIVQKMEISSEAEEHDGPQLFQGYRDKPLPCQSKWNPLLRALAARK